MGVELTSWGGGGVNKLGQDFEGLLYACSHYLSKPSQVLAPGQLLRILPHSENQTPCSAPRSSCCWLDPRQMFSLCMEQSPQPHGVSHEAGPCMLMFARGLP